MQAAEAQQRSQADAWRARQDAGVPIVKQVLAEFLKAVHPQLQPKRYRVGRGLRATASPRGYALHNLTNISTRHLVVVASDGRLWEYFELRTPSLGHQVRRGYFELNGQTLDRLQVDHCPVMIGTDGKPYISSGGEYHRQVPLQEALAAVAHRLIRSGHPPDDRGGVL